MYVKENYSNKVQRSVNVEYERSVMTKRGHCWMERIFHRKTIFFTWMSSSFELYGFFLFSSFFCSCAFVVRVWQRKHRPRQSVFISRQIFTNGNKRHHFQNNYLDCLNFLRYVLLWNGWKIKPDCQKKLNEIIKYKSKTKEKQCTE